MASAKYVTVHEGERTEEDIDERVHEHGGQSRVSIIARHQGYIADGVLADEVMHNENVAERAVEEGAFFGTIGVPFWFRQKDDEVAETFAGDDVVYALIEDYSEKAWRIVAKEAGTPGDSWFVYEWTFVPKSLATVQTVEPVEGAEHARAIGRKAYEAEKARREARQDEWDAADGWREKLDLVDPQGAD